MSVILFCLPYAGGSEAMYYGWKKYLSSSIRLEPVELKGRGKRYNEGHYESMDEMVEDVFLNIRDRILYDEYAFFGHSMGALLAFELYYRICAENLRKAAHIFFSGLPAPSVRKIKKKIHTLPDEEFLREVIDMGGTPEELLANKEWLQLVLPLLRSDFTINENYVYVERENKIECGVTVLKGSNEEMTLEELLAWKSHCVRGFKQYTLTGDHFFINDNAENITRIINSLLAR